MAADPPVGPWADAVGRELAAVAQREGWDGPLELETVYLGGGTPSLLGTGAVSSLLDALDGHVRTDGVREFTAEANPERFSAELARDWRAAGVGRISFGVQTFHAPTLRWMGRLHGPEGPGRAVRTARAAGIDNLGLDLIFGLPPRLGRSLGHDLDRILALEPEHVSVYGLSVEPGTPLGRWVEEGRVTMPDGDRYREEYLQVAERLRDEGYHHYEVSNFARPGREARHNAAYWSGGPYLGLGNGAHSYVGGRRWWNRRDWAAYRRAVAVEGDGREDSESLGDAERRLERIWLGLRTDRGLSDTELGPNERRVARRWVGEGLAEWRDGRLRLTLEGWLLLDRLTVELEDAG